MINKLWFRRMLRWWVSWGAGNWELVGYSLILLGDVGSFWLAVDAASLPGGEMWWVGELIQLEKNICEQRRKLEKSQLIHNPHK